MRIILASRSPRRLKLLQSAGLSVKVRPVQADERILAGEDTRAAVMRIARIKAHSVAAPESIPVVAADTLLSVDGDIIGKPDNRNVARSMLRRLSGKRHEVYTGVCVRLGPRSLVECARTRVRFRTLSEEEIQTYLRHNEVLDLAGAYAIQEGAASFITAVTGPLDNVIGLPVRLTLDLLAAAFAHPQTTGIAA